MLLLLLAGYRRLVSPLVHALAGGGCRFHPSCSAYAEGAIGALGAWRGGWRALGRLVRCHPFSPGGYDPPPG